MGNVPIRNAAPEKDVAITTVAPNSKFLRETRRGGGASSSFNIVYTVYICICIRYGLDLPPLSRNG